MKYPFLLYLQECVREEPFGASNYFLRTKPFGQAGLMAVTFVMRLPFAQLMLTALAKPLPHFGRTIVTKRTEVFLMQTTLVTSPYPFGHFGFSAMTLLAEVPRPHSIAVAVENFARHRGAAATTTSTVLPLMQYLVTTFA
jgi:hypothetical protein